MTHEFDNFDFALEAERLRHQLWVCREMIAGRRDRFGRRVRSTDELSQMLRLLDEPTSETRDAAR